MNEILKYLKIFGVEYMRNILKSRCFLQQLIYSPEALGNVRETACKTCSLYPVSVDEYICADYKIEEVLQ